MPFRLCDAATILQAFIEEILEPFRELTTSLLNDVCIFSDSDEESHLYMIKIFSRFYKYDPVINTSKISFLC